MSGRREVSIDGGGVRRLPWAPRDPRPSDRTGPAGSAPVFGGQPVVRPSSAPPPPLRRTTRNTRSTRPSSTMTTRAATCESEQTKGPYWFARALSGTGDGRGPDRARVPLDRPANGANEERSVQDSISRRRRSRQLRIVQAPTRLLLLLLLGRPRPSTSRRWRAATLCRPRRWLGASAPRSSSSTPPSPASTSPVR